MGAGVKAAEHGRYTTPTDDVRRRHGLLPPRTGLIYRIMMAHGGVPHSHGELIHRSAWNRNSRKFAFWAFSEVRFKGVLGSCARPCNPSYLYSLYNTAGLTSPALWGGGSRCPQKQESTPSTS